MRISRKLVPQREGGTAKAIALFWLMLFFLGASLLTTGDATSAPIASRVSGSAGKALTWGLNPFGQLGRTSLAATCTPDTQARPCSFTPAPVEGLGPVVSLAGGSEHTLALKQDGSVWAWGQNDQGQLGVETTGMCAFPGAPDTPCSKTPVQVRGSGGNGFLSGIKAIGAGSPQHVGPNSTSSYAVDSEGRVWSWGANHSRKLGVGDECDEGGRHPCIPGSDTPLQVEAEGGGFLDGVVAVDGGAWHGVALRADGTVWAWGMNEGQLGTGENEFFGTSLAVQVRGDGPGGYLTDIKEIASGDNHTVALRADGTVWGWGSNMYGQADGTNVFRASPAQVLTPDGEDPMTGVKAIAAGQRHSIAVMDSPGPGSVVAWGKPVMNAPLPGKPAAIEGFGSGADIVSVGVGAGVTIAAKKDGSVWALGSNLFGEAGTGEPCTAQPDTSSDYVSPCEYPNPVRVAQLDPSNEAIGGLALDVCTTSVGAAGAFGYAIQVPNPCPTDPTPRPSPSPTVKSAPSPDVTESPPAPEPPLEIEAARVGDDRLDRAVILAANAPPPPPPNPPGGGPVQVPVGGPSSGVSAAPSAQNAISQGLIAGSINVPANAPAAAAGIPALMEAQAAPRYSMTSAQTSLFLASCLMLGLGGFFATITYRWSPVQNPSPAWSR